jgi:hypothetical protein
MNKLAEFQSKLKVPKNQFNAFGKYKYRSAEDIIEAVKALINPAGFSLNLIDEIALIGERFYVKATATISNGTETYLSVAYAREEETKKGMDGSQITGAASSYARKYALNGLFAIDDTKDADATNDHKETKLHELSPKSDKWNKAVEYCASKGIDGIVKKYYLSEENRELMLNQALELTEEATKAEKNGL